MMYQLTLFIMGMIASVLVIIVGLNTNDKSKATQYVFIGSIIVMGLFYVYAKYTCGPNPFTVKKMKPMAEKISEYIIKNGVPKSLKDIPGLPYRLDGCEKNEEYLNSDNNGGIVKVSKEKAILYNINEKCHFSNIELEYWFQKDSEEENHISVSLKMVSSDKTVYNTGLVLNEHNQFIKLETDIGSYKSTGICNSMRQ